MLIYVVTDRKLRPDLTLARLFESVARSGADLIQIREKDLSTASLLDCAGKTVAASAGAQVFVNSRPDVALAAGAAGVHLPASGLAASMVRARWGGRLRIGVSTHGLEEAMSAEAEGADLITFGPVFDTPSKRAYGPPAGLERLGEVLGRVRVPVFAIGGINRSTWSRLAGFPLAGVAVISAVISAPDMARAVTEMREALS